MRKDDCGYASSFPYAVIVVTFCLALVCQFFAQSPPKSLTPQAPAEGHAFGQS